MAISPISAVLPKLDSLRVNQVDFAATGCVSIASSDDGVSVDRVIEYFAPSFGLIWVDVFFSKSSDLLSTISMLHRGSVLVSDVTGESWGSSSLDGLASMSGVQGLTSRIIRLHKSYAPIDFLPDGRVSVLSTNYVPLVTTPETVAGAQPGANVPFSMWEFELSENSGQFLVRLQLDMTTETLHEQVHDDEFYACGEEILLDKIRFEDIPSHKQPDRDGYRRKLDEFCAKRRIVPDLFEYLIVSLDSEDLDWKARALSPKISPRNVDATDLAKNTRWFVTVGKNDPRWDLQAYKSFVIKAWLREAS